MVWRNFCALYQGKRLPARICVQVAQVNQNAMNKSVIVVIAAVWIISLTYTTLAKAYHYPYREYSVIAAWASAALMFVCIIMYVAKHRSTRS